MHVLCLHLFYAILFQDDWTSNVKYKMLLELVIGLQAEWAFTVQTGGAFQPALMTFKAHWFQGRNETSVHLSPIRANSEWQQNVPKFGFMPRAQSLDPWRGPLSCWGWMMHSAFKSLARSKDGRTEILQRQSSPLKTVLCRPDIC